MKLKILTCLVGVLTLGLGACRLGHVSYDEYDLSGTWNFIITHDSDGSQETGWFQFDFGSTSLVDDWWNESQSSIFEDPGISNIDSDLSRRGVFSLTFEFDYGNEYGRSTISGQMSELKRVITSTYLYDEWQDLGNGFEHTPSTGTIVLTKQTP